ncbi:MAG: CvpA family protein [Eubacteriales bacterium]|nr:CvpA family protein [Eubacteriales bacterium]MDD3881139.1 CvpA family protein [Eubacteriales bacterium]MDD4511521.1 CvpA family protein [Eubacteriales bacterium]
MNIVDYIILGVMLISTVFGFYRGFIHSIAGLGATIGSVFIAYWQTPNLVSWLQANTGITETLVYYTDASSRIGDLQLALTNVAGAAQGTIQTVLDKVALPKPISDILSFNLQNQVFAGSGASTVSDYLSQTIVGVMLNILCFVAIFIVAFILLSVLLNMLRAVFRFPLLKHLDTLLGGAAGFARGAIIVFVIFLLLPMVESVVPMQSVQKLVDESLLAGIFDSGKLLMMIINRSM